MASAAPPRPRRSVLVPHTVDAGSPRDGLRRRALPATNVPDNPSLPAILAAVSQNVDRAMPNNKGRTDLGEMAQTAAAEVTKSARDAAGLVAL